MFRTIILALLAFQLLSPLIGGIIGWLFSSEDDNGINYGCSIFIAIIILMILGLC